MTAQSQPSRAPVDPIGRLRQTRLPDELGIFVAFVVIFLVLALFTRNFAQPASLLQVVRSISFFGIMAIGMTFMLALGEIDISVGSIFYLVAVVTSQLMVSGIDPWIAAVVGIAFGGVLGLVNGGMALLLGIPVIIVSLGTLPLFRGIGLILSNTSDVVIVDDSSSLFGFINTKVADIVPMPAIIFVLLAVACHILLQFTRFGYRVQATGSNPQAALLAGVPTTRTRLQVTALMGITCGISGVLAVGFFRAVDASVGTSFELLVISAVIIGGTSLLGGSGTVIGTVIGVLIIAEISSGIVHFGVPSTLSGFVTGAVILIAIALDRLVRRRQSLRLLTARRRERQEA
jgi:ribose transport system permease protein